LHNAVEQTHYHDDLLFPARLVRNILEGNLEEMDTLTTFFVVSGKCWPKITRGNQCLFLSVDDSTVGCLFVSCFYGVKSEKKRS